MCCAYKQTGKGTSGFDCLMIPGASNAASNPGEFTVQYLNFENLIILTVS
jgi:hypothetical protein